MQRLEKLIRKNEKSSKKSTKIDNTDKVMSKKDSQRIFGAIAFVLVLAVIVAVEPINLTARNGIGTAQSKLLIQPSNLTTLTTSVSSTTTQTTSISATTIIPIEDRCVRLDNLSGTNQFKVASNAKMLLEGTVNYVTPNYAGITVNNSFYVAYTDNSYILNGVSPQFTMSLLNITYVPIEHAVTFQLCSDVALDNLTTIGPPPGASGGGGGGGSGGGSSGGGSSGGAAATTTQSTSITSTTASTTIISSGGGSQLHTVAFSVYTNSSTLLGQLKSYYKNANPSDLLIDNEYSSFPARIYLNYYNQPQSFGRVIIANNYSEISSDVLSPYVNDVGLARLYNFTHNDYIAYDPEDWNLTPAYEQAAVPNYTQSACLLVHQAGYSFGWAGEIDVPGWGEFSKINWRCVDLLDLQEQFLQNSTSDLVRNVTQLASIARSENPSIKVFVQLNMQGSSQSRLESDILAISAMQGINGVMLQDLCTYSSCNNELVNLVNYTTAIGTASTSSTTTIPATQIGNLALYISPTSVPATNSINGGIRVNVSGTGFTPNSTVNLGYTYNFRQPQMHSYRRKQRQMDTGLDGLLRHGKAEPTMLWRYTLRGVNKTASFSVT